MQDLHVRAQCEVWTTDVHLYYRNSYNCCC